MTIDEALNVCATVPHYDEIVAEYHKRGSMEMLRRIRIDCRVGLVEAAQILKAMKQVEGFNQEARDAK